MLLTKQIICFAIFLTLALASTPPWDDLKSNVTGNVYLPGDAEYTAIRDGILAIADNVPADQPLAIVQPISAVDVSATIKFANAHGIADVTALAGGHGADGFSFPLDGIQIDFSKMTSITVDSVGKTVEFEPGVLSGNLTNALAPYNLGHAQGNCPSIGAAGFLSYGGYGFWTRAEGLGIDTIVEYELVTAAGDIITVSETQNSDLFFACRGALPVYGIATKFKLNVYDTSNFFGGRLFYEFTDFGNATQALIDWFTTIYDTPDLINDPNFNSRITVSNVADFFPVFRRKTRWVLEVIFLGPDSDELKKQKLAPLIDIDNPDFYPEFINPNVTQRLPTDYNTYNTYNFEEQIENFNNLAGIYSYFRQGQVAQSTITKTGAMDQFLDKYMREGFDWDSVITLFQVGEISTAGGATSAVAPSDTAFYPREDFDFFWGYWTSYQSVASFDQGRAYYDQIANELTELGELRGFYGNLNTVRFGREFDGLGTNLPKLESIKQEWDPNNLFSRGWDITPNGVGANCINPVDAHIVVVDGLFLKFRVEMDQQVNFGNLTFYNYVSLALYDDLLNVIALYNFESFTDCWSSKLNSNGTVKTWKYAAEYYNSVKITKVDKEDPEIFFKLLSPFLGSSYNIPDLPFPEPTYARIELGTELCIHVNFTSPDINNFFIYQADEP